MQPINFVRRPKTHLKGKFCSIPFTDLSVDEKGNFTLCRCQHHMNFIIGNDGYKKAWKSTLAEEVRQSVWNGTFDYCSWSCPGLNELVDRPGALPKYKDPERISISFDLSCNLKCPSCREKVIIEKDPAILDKQQQLIDDLLTIQGKVIVDPCNNGDPLVSPASMYFLKKLAEGDMPNIKLNLSTNGTLIYHYKDLISKLENRILGFSISIDAASKSVYEQVRGGHWDDLMQGLDWLSTKTVKRSSRFVVQQKNWQEIVPFVHMCQRLGFSSVHFQKLRDWGHWSDSWWKENSLTKEQFQEVNQISKSLIKEFGDFVVFDREFAA